MLKNLWLPASLAVIAIASTPAAAIMQGRQNYVQAVISFKPLAYFRLEGTSGGSEVGGAKYSPMGGAAASSDCAPIGVKNNHCVAFNGTDAYIATTQTGGITTAGSILAWVDLAELPSTAKHMLYVAGESKYQNDLDVQFETDDVLRFYTASGSNVDYTPDPKTLVNQWHMIVVTFNTVSGERDIYWDGTLAAHDTNGGEPNKTNPFLIGYSTVFPGRWFHGSIDEVALWDRALSASEVASLYRIASLGHAHTNGAM